MLHHIENKFIKLSIHEKGAEMHHLQCNGIEYLWQADKAWWGWHAPHLFPIIGRLNEDTFLHNGKSFKMEKHGFARHSHFQMIDKTDTDLAFRLTHNTETLAQYPFEFTFDVLYRIVEEQVSITYRIQNNGNEPMFYNVGGHPAFNCPILPGLNFEDYQLLFAEQETLSRALLNKGVFTGETVPIMNNTSILPLIHTDYALDAIIFFTLNSRKVQLRHPKNDANITVTFNDFEQLGIWQAQGAPYICIEPWVGHADIAGSPSEISSKKNIQKLEPGALKHYTYTIGFNI